MADVQNVITLGIGSAPGSIKFFVLMGLDTNPVAAVTGIVAWKLPTRDFALTLKDRNFSSTLSVRDFAWTLDDDER